MDLGWRYWASARSQQLVQPSVLAARSRTAQRSRTGAGGFGLGSLARPGAPTRFPPCVLAVCMARVERLWLWRSWRHGFLQFRYDFSSPKAGSADECGSEFERALRRDLPAGFDHPLHLPGRSEEHTSELQSHHDLVCRLLLEKQTSRPNSHTDGFVVVAAGP